MAVQNFGAGGGGFQQSPGVNVSEVDLTTITPAVDTTVGAFAGTFRWGPVNSRVLITSENELVRRFGKPTALNPETFFTAANFLSYSNALNVVRAANTTSQFAAVGGETGSSSTLTGNVTATNTSPTVTGTGTIFQTQLSVGQKISTSSGQLGTIQSITNNTVLTLSSNSAFNATGETFFSDSAAKTSLTVLNDDDYDTKSTGWGLTNVQFIARWPGDVGNSLKVSMCENAEQYSSSVNLASQAMSSNTFSGANTGFTLVVGSSVATVTLDASGTIGGATFGNLAIAATTVANKLGIGDYLQVGDRSSQSLKIIAKSGIAIANTGGANTGVCSFTVTFDQPLKLAENVSQQTVTRFWEYYTQVSAAPGRSTYVATSGNTAAQLANASAQFDEVHVVVIDEDGGFTGSPGAILEVFQSLSRATDAKLADGATNYFKNVVNDTSEYIWIADDRSTAPSNTALNVATATATTPLTLSLSGGVDISESNMPFASIATAYDLFVSPEDVDISLVLTGKSRGGTNGEQLGNYLIDNIAEVRKDCVVFISPEQADVVNTNDADLNVVTFRNSLRSTSYAVMDSGYKYQYDKYNDVYRWIPLNGDIAGLCVRTDNTRDPWFSPAGESRGQIRNVIRLAFNPNKAQRDYLYKNGVNPVISEPGRGAILFGDKTLQAKASAFDRINVRRLFIVLEKAISRAAKSFLFEFNDEFTRAQFRNIIEPYLRDVQGRRGIYDFKVVCDETNNTAEVIDSNRFVGDIYIKPARSINFIQLNFVAVRSGVEFTELVG